MSDPILKATTFTFKIADVEFVMKRRSTYIMAQARGFRAVLGALGGEEAVASGNAKIEDVTENQTVNMIEGIFRVALLSPVLADEGEPTVPGKCYSFEDLAPFHDLAFHQFMASGLELSPLPNSCEAQTEPPSQEL